LFLGFLRGGKVLLLYATRKGTKGPESELAWWDLDKQKVIRRHKFARGVVVALSADGKTLVVGSDKEKDDTIKVLDAETARERKRLRGEYDHSQAKLSADGRL